MTHLMLILQLMKMMKIYLNRLFNTLKLVNEDVRGGNIV